MRSKHLAIFLTGMSLLVSPLFGVGPTGTIVGTVNDPSG